MLDAKKVKNDIVEWIKKWFEDNGKGCNAIVGISGGKDSSIIAALCVEALGKDRVIGVTMPNVAQNLCNGTDSHLEDENYAKELIKFLGIKSFNVPISSSYNDIVLSIQKGTNSEQISFQTLVNLSPRLRMATLYAISQTYNGRVANTCNLSEDWVGYSTRWGDSVGDFSPLADLTVTEVKQIGYELGLPVKFVNKKPSDGLCGKSDEDNLEFTYDELDKYIREGICENEVTKDKIDMLHEKNLFKLNPIQKFKL